jgi:VWA domain containing CoxE-like protein
MPYPLTHRQTGTPARARTDPAWQQWSDAWTRHVPTLTGRTDLTVTVAPGAGGGAPASFYPATGLIEVDATHIATDIGTPDATNPRRAGHKHLVPTGYGLLVHEAAHAVHSRWQPPPGTPPVVASIAGLLEESRAESRHRTRRPRDRRWLRHTVNTLLIDPDDAPVDDLWHAAYLAGLLLARVDARIITGRDARGIRAAVTTVLGRDRLNQLREIWRQAHTVDDTDAATMIRLARRWCRLVGIDPVLRPGLPQPDPGVFPGRLAAALTDYLAAVRGLTPGEYAAALIAGHVADRHGAPAQWRRRHPTPQEQAAARRLAARLQQARSENPEPGRQPSRVPSGRLRTRAAIARDAQRAAGTVPTATPWQRRTQLPPPKPILHLGVLVDVSTSMQPYTRPLSTAGWVLAHAARRAGAVTATIAFADRVTLLIPPRQQPGQVLEMVAGGGTSTFTDAVKLADRLLDLRHPRTLRMLAVVSDGDFPDIQPAQKLITTLHRAGCPVLWLQPADLPGHTYTDTTTIQVTDPVQAIGHITDAAIAALANM